MGSWRTVTLPLYGRKTTLQLKTRVVWQRTLNVKIRLVAVCLKNRPVVFLFCTDLTMSAGGIVSAYCARFAIETGFRDAKQSFGFSTYQVRLETRIVSLVHLCLWSQTLLRLYCWRKQPAQIYGAWRKSLSYLTLSQQKRVSASHCRVSGGLLGTFETAENAEMQAFTIR